MAYSARPVPQNIMNVEFKFFDFVTIRQFLTSFGLLVLCAVLYFLLPSPWKIIIPILCLILGGIIIYVPFNGEPFGSFISLYLEALILPQRRIWNKRGVVVKTAYRQAHKYQFGNDPTDDFNKFKFQSSTEQIKLSPEQEKLDVEEDKFIHDQNTTNSGNMNAKYSPPSNKQQPTQQKPLNNPNSTSVSSRSIQTSVNLNQFPDKQEPISLVQEKQGQPEKPEIENSQTPTEPAQQIETPQPEIKQEETKPQVQINIPTPQQPTENHEAPQKEQEVIITNHVPNYISSETKAQDLPQDQPITEQKTLSETIAQPSQAAEAQSSVNVEETIKEIKEMSPPQVQKRDEDELALRNYIFGTVEDGKGGSVSGAAIVIKNNDENQEVTYSKQNGDFQSVHEYKAGEYLLHVNVDSEEFNEVRIQHDPIDPIPVIIKPKVVQSILPQPHEVEEQITTDPDVFSGNYDSRSFDLGNDYEELEVKLNKQPEEQTIHQEDNFETNVLNNLDDNVPQDLIATREDTQLNLATQPDKLQSFDKHELINFSILDTAQAKMDSHLLNIPNTINGRIISATAQPLAGVLVNILDREKNIVKSIGTDMNGIFYSFTSLPDGFYYIELSKSGYEFPSFYINLQNSTQEPKDIKSFN